VIPERIDTSVPVMSLAAGSNHSMAHCVDGAVLVWGGNSVGQLGNESTQPSSIPLLLSLSNVKDISAGWDHGVVLRNDGMLQAWGLNVLGQLGSQTESSYSNVPLTVTPPEAEL
jgi:alpha-tubulin suppressor-like RCC1 family protein